MGSHPSLTGCLDIFIIKNLILYVNHHCRAISRSKELRMSISENIRMYRKAAGLTQKMLAAKCGMAEITIRQYESGKREPRSRQLTRIADALNISADSLILGSTIEYTARSGTDAGYIRRMNAWKDTGMMLEITPDIRKILQQSEELRHIFQRLLKYVISFQVDKEDLLLLTEEKNAKNAVRKCFKDSELQVLIVRDGDETRTFRL